MSKGLMAFIISFLIVVILGMGFAALYVTFVKLDTDAAEHENIYIGRSAMVEIVDGLWYNSETCIVYWWNKYQPETTPTPYYAPNGLPYRYNPNTNSLEEIE